MNEMVVDGENGVLIIPKGTAKRLLKYQIMGEVVDLWADLTPENICTAVEKVLKIPASDRQVMGAKSREMYEADKNAMIENMKWLVQESSL